MAKERSQRAFAAITLTVVIAIAAVLVVYAAILGSLQGGEVTVGGVTGDIGYCLINATGTWTSTLSVSGTGISWYTRMNTTGNEYIGPVEITWQLQQKQGGGSWTDLGSSTTTNIDLTASSQTIYASSDGGISTNRDWSLTATSTASYRVVLTIESTGT